MAVKEAQAGTVLTIDLDAIRDNYRSLRAKANRAACAGRA
jgi:alanine racemase